LKLSDTKSAIIVYREIRIEDKFTDENGSQVRLKPEAEVEVTVEAEPEATVPTQGDEGVQNAPRENDGFID